MTRIAVVTSSPPGTEGGHMVIARSLVTALHDARYDASLVVTPDYGFGRNASTYWANYTANVGGVDQVISLRYPSYAVRHPRHVCWLNHTAREYYDLWPSFSAALSPFNLVKEGIRRTGLHFVDRRLLRGNVHRLVAQSGTIQRRLSQDFGIAAEIVWPPAPQRPYRCDGYGDYVLAVSRLVPLKRLDLLVRALHEPAARHVRAVVAGDGECRSALEHLAVTLGVRDRVSFVGHMDEPALMRHLAECRAVWFAPVAEDYGFVTVEAFSASKAVITCHDSGGPAELVTDGEHGFVVAPTPAAAASALGRLVDDAALAERLGRRARVRADTLSWSDAVRRLVIV